MGRNVSLDVLKLVMALMVIGLHAKFLSEFSALASYLTVNGVFRLAVPIFLIINGFYFFPVVTKNTQFDWLKRVLILYVVWMSFYVYFWFSIPQMSLVGVANLAKNIVIGYHHLWYISGMLGAAILLLLFRRFSSTFLVATVLGSSLAGIIIQYLGNYHYFEGFVLDRLFNMHWFHRNALLFSYPFFCIGYLINKHKYHNKITLQYAAKISIIGIALLIFESYFNFYQESRDGGFDNYLSLLIACPFVFILFQKTNLQGSSKNIALHSSAIFFIHSFFLSLLKKYTEIKPTPSTFYCILLSAIASYFIIKINNRVGYIL